MELGMLPLKKHARLLLSCIVFTLIQISTSSHSHHRKHTHHKFPDGSITVGLHLTPEEQKGPWSDWSESSECSRSCGGGVTSQIRTCQDSSHNSTSCHGPSKRYISCNIQDCPEGSRDFRELQCAKFDAIPFGGKYFTWIPYRKGFNECELNCMPKGGDKFYYRHSQAVVDGTRCRDDSMDTCVQGVCMAVGCDMMLGSIVKEDKCQECGGDGSNCRTVEGIFNQTNLQVGYNDIILIPAGATTIKIKELEPTNNYLAIRNSSGFYYLNGNWQIEFPRKMKFAGTHWHYDKKSQGYAGLEHIYASGPTTEPIFIALLYQQRNFGISYEYSVPLGISNTQPDNYIWVYSNYGDCNRTCGGGIQKRSVSCATSVTNEIVAEYLCDYLTKPPTSQTCNESPCPAHWQVTEWDECSKSCDGGVQYRQVICQQGTNGGAMVVPDSECIANDGAKPLYARTCNELACPSWKVEEWEACDKMCGEGLQKRNVICIMKVGDLEKIISDEFCPPDKPELTKHCLSRPCDETEWIVSEWSGCDSVCGLSMESRVAHCASEDGNLHKEEMCLGKNKPPLERKCTTHSHCKAMWHASEWSECSVHCGKGIKTRTVFCGAWQDGNIHKVSEELCSESDKMSNQEDCFGDKCSALWFTGPWTRCSVPCGGGQQTRKVMCLMKDSVVTHDNCDAQLQPFDIEPCNMHPCDEDEIMMVGGCHKSKYGCCTDGITPAGPDFEGCPFDGSEQDCKESEFGCCIDGVTPASGPFGKGCPKMINCNDTKYGCCPDGVTAAKSSDMLGCYEDCDNSLWGCCPDGFTPALGKNNEGCEPETKCSKTTYGCCPDGVSIASGSDYDGCDLDVSSGEDCLFSEFGCCPDGITSATGPHNHGCHENQKKHEPDCKKSQYGCCSDGFTVAEGPDLQGCVEGSGDPEINCKHTFYGCCPDDVTPSKGPEFQGCHETSTFTSLIDIATVATPASSPCDQSIFGCCKDGLTPATGPNHHGCHKEEFSSLCANTLFGCCPDGKTAAQGPSLNGCCFSSEFGCCPDNMTIASGPYNGGCSCHTYPHGCCPDGVTVAKGHRFEGCSCEHSAHGCCQDNYSYAKGPNFEGCDCKLMLYGCCFDGITPAMNSNGKGCECENLRYGCCPDGQMPATGPSYEGCPCKTFPHGCCPDGKTVSRTHNLEDCPCEAMTHGCCPDHKTAAKGPYNEGCPCHSMLHGCCPDNTTVAQGPKLMGCPCMSMPFGCCPDKQMAATGPNFHGCPCKTTVHGCCPDGDSPAKGPKYEGCHCTTFPYGCCPDGVTPARDQNFGGCKDHTHKNSATSDVCSLPKERGPCHNFSVKWYFDVTYGACSRFWYGGCDGNGNQFNSQEECENVCVTPEGPEACSLPKVVGPCKSYSQHWYYEPETDSCKTFNYSGCLGNNNRFESKKMCESTCVQQAVSDACEQPIDVGPCKKVTQRWFFDKSEDACKPFIYGGCKGNHNNFESEKECMQRCVTSKPKDPSTLYSAAIGSQVTMICKAIPSTENDEPILFLWYKGDSAYPIHGVDKRQGGKSLVASRGTDPRFTIQDNDLMTALTIHKIRKEDEGQYRCRVDYLVGPTTNRFMILNIGEQGVCNLPHAVGNCYQFRERWYYNSHEKKCQRFYYSGCGGNENNFGTYLECEKQCEKSFDQTTVDELFSIEYCKFEPDAGPCSGRKIQWFYDKDGVCKQFYYGGCRGNGNRFSTKKECEIKCASSQDICKLPKIRGPCSGSFIQWHFDAEHRECKEFSYSGCQGNGNRFNDRETCEIQCKKWPAADNHLHHPRDACSQNKDPGPCLGYFLMWYHDAEENACRSFVYGGCHGNDNRFKTLEECEAKCHTNSPNIRKAKATHHSSTAAASFITNEDICRQTPDEGHCGYSQSRYYYDPHKGMCLPFVYKGCGGNKNRFKNADLCMRFCAGVHGSEIVGDAAVRDVEPFEINKNCPASNCPTLQCPHGIEEIVDVRGCISCLCSNPCESHSCPDGSQCVVEKYPEGDGEFRSQPICRLKTKKGSCPSSSPDHLLNGTCHDRCHSDADCTGALKCCYISCANICVLPEIADEDYDIGENDIEDSVPETPSPPQILAARRDVAVKKGTPALLRCIVKGYPSPKVKWFHKNHPLESEGGDYKISVEGSLHIISVDTSNEGIYSCTAENGIGKAVTQFFNLIVYEDTKVNVTLVTPAYKVGSPLQLDCVVEGTFPMEINWHLGENSKALESNEHREILENHTLYISSAQYNDSGDYICEAQNQHGKAFASIDIQVHVVSVPSTCKDSPFFTGCAMIVKQNYCNNPTYAKFCCLSCALAEQIHTDKIDKS